MTCYADAILDEIPEPPPTKNNRGQTVHITTDYRVRRCLLVCLRPQLALGVRCSCVGPALHPGAPPSLAPPSQSMTAHRAFQFARANISADKDLKPGPLYCASIGKINQLSLNKESEHMVRGGKAAQTT